MATIASIALKMTADVEGVTRGMGLVAKEARLVKQAFSETRTDGEKLQAALGKLESVKAGFRTLDDYKRAVHSVKMELDSTYKAEQQLAEGIRARARAIPYAGAFRGAGAQLGQIGRLRGAGELSMAETFMGGAQALQGLPLIGSLAGYVGSMHPALLAAKAGFVGLTAAIGAYTTMLGGAIVATISQAKSMADLAGVAGRLGYTTEQMAGLNRQARRSGVDLEALEKGLRKVQEIVGKGGLGEEEGLKTFKKLGIDIEKLRAAQPGQQLQTITDALGKVASPAERAALSIKIFGEDFRALLPVIASGKSMADMVREAAEAGETFSQNEADAVRESFREWKLIKDEFANSLIPVVKELAPVVRQAMGELHQLMSTGGGRQASSAFVLTLLTNGAQKAAGAMDKATSVASAMVATFEGLTGNLSGAKDTLYGISQTPFTDWLQHLAAAADMAKAMSAAIQAIPVKQLKLPTNEAWVADAAKLTAELRHQINTWGLAEDAIKYFDLAMAGADADTLERIAALQKTAAELKKLSDVKTAIKSLTDSLREQGMEAKMGADWTERWKLKQQGATDAQLEAIRVLQEDTKAKKDAAELSKQQDEQAKQLKESLRSPIEAINDQIAGFKKLLDAKKITQAEFEAAKKKAWEPFVAKFKTEGTTSTIAGTREWAEAIIRERKRVADKNAKIEMPVEDWAAKADWKRPDVSKAPPNFNGQPWWKDRVIPPEPQPGQIEGWTAANVEAMQQTWAGPVLDALRSIVANTGKTADADPIEIEEVSLTGA